MLLAVVGMMAMVAVIGMVSMDEGPSADATVGDQFTVGELIYEVTADEEVEVAEIVSSGYEGSIEIPASVSDEASEYIVTSIGSMAFYNCRFLSSVTIPNTVTTLGSMSFRGCVALSSITIPDSVTTIESTAFAESGLTSIDIPDGVSRIEGMTFRNCSALASVTFGEGISYIGHSAFDGCTSLTFVTFESSASPEFANNAVFDTGTTINVYTPGWDPVAAMADYLYEGTTVVWANPPQTGGTAFSYNGIEYTFYADGTELYISGYEGAPTEVVIPDTVPYGEGTYKVTSMEEYVFAGCTTLTSMTLLDGIESIGTEAFSGCTNLSSITLPDGIASIGDRAFSGCSALASVDLPDNITMIGQTAFAGTGLTSVTIPSKVTEIGGGAFFACQGLNTVIFETESVPTLGNTVFETTTTINVYTPGWDPVAALADAHSSATTVVWANPPYPDLIFVSDPSDGTLTFGHFVTVYNDGEYYGTYWVEHGTVAHIVFEKGSSSIACSCGQEFHTSNSEQSPMYDGLDEVIEDVTVYHFGGWTHSHQHGGDNNTGGGVLE